MGPARVLRRDPGRAQEVGEAGNDSMKSDESEPTQEEARAPEQEVEVVVVEEEEEE